MKSGFGTVEDLWMTSDDLKFDYDSDISDVSEISIYNYVIKLAI